MIAEQTCHRRGRSKLEGDTAGAEWVFDHPESEPDLRDRRGANMNEA